jgi:hypothetical protein
VGHSGDLNSYREIIDGGLLTGGSLVWNLGGYIFTIAYIYTVLIV